MKFSISYWVTKHKYCKKYLFDWKKKKILLSYNNRIIQTFRLLEKWMILSALLIENTKTTPNQNIKGAQSKSILSCFAHWHRAFNTFELYHTYAESIRPAIESCDLFIIVFTWQIAAATRSDKTWIVSHISRDFENTMLECVNTTNYRFATLYDQFCVVCYLFRAHK